MKKTTKKVAAKKAPAKKLAMTKDELLNPKALQKIFIDALPAKSSTIKVVEKSTATLIDEAAAEFPEYFDWKNFLVKLRIDRKRSKVTPEGQVLFYIEMFCDGSHYRSTSDEGKTGKWEEFSTQCPLADLRAAVKPLRAIKPPVIQTDTEKQTTKAASAKTPAADKPPTERKAAPNDGQKIYRISKSNPRKEGTHGWKSFNLIKDGMTIADYRKAGGRNADLNWDLEHNYVEVR